MRKYNIYWNQDGKGYSIKECSLDHVLDLAHQILSFGGEVTSIINTEQD